MDQDKCLLGVTLYHDEKNMDLFSLSISMEKTEQVITALSAKFEQEGLNGNALHEKLKEVLNDITEMHKLERYIPVEYVDRSRDLSDVLAIDSEAHKQHYFYYTRENMQPLLDALQKGDFELAKALAPQDKKLLGYVVYTEPKEVTEYGSYAADYWVTTVPPGIYPVFASKYDRHEAKEMYQNKLKDFQGISIWLEGTYSGGNFYNPETDKDSRNTLWRSPYAHAVAKSILEQPENVMHLLQPFEARENFFYSSYDKEIHSSYEIRDTSLPDFMKENPMNMKDMKKHKPIHEQIKEAESRRPSENRPEDPSPVVLTRD